MTQLSFNLYNSFEKLQNTEYSEAETNVAEVDSKSSASNAASGQLFSAQQDYSRASQSDFLFQSKMASQDILVNNAFISYQAADNKVNSLNSTIDTVDGIINQTQSKMDGLSSQIFSNDSNLATMKSDYNSETSALSSSKSQKAIMMRQKSNYYRAVMNYDTAINNITSQISNIDTQIQTLRTGGEIQIPMLDENGRQMVDTDGNPMMQTIKAGSANAETVIAQLEQQKAQLEAQKQEQETQKSAFIANNNKDFDSMIGNVDDQINALAKNVSNLKSSINNTLDQNYNLSLEKLAAQEKYSQNVNSKKYLEVQLTKAENDKERRYEKYSNETNKLSSVSEQKNIAAGYKSEKQDKLTSAQNEYNLALLSSTDENAKKSKLGSLKA